MLRANWILLRPCQRLLLHMVMDSPRGEGLACCVSRVHLLVCAVLMRLSTTVNAFSVDHL
jgi:hypothetical protein